MVHRAAVNLRRVKEKSNDSLKRGHRRAFLDLPEFPTQEKNTKPQPIPLPKLLSEMAKWVNIEGTSKCARDVPFREGDDEDGGMFWRSEVER